jgi:hypothetical protein
MRWEPVIKCNCFRRDYAAHVKRRRRPKAEGTPWYFDHACELTFVDKARTVAEFRKHAEECRELAKKLTREDDKKAMELMANAWEKVANDRERELKSK